MSVTRLSPMSFLGHALISACLMALILVIGFGGTFLVVIHTPVNLVWIPLAVGCTLTYAAIKWLESSFHCKYE